MERKRLTFSRCDPGVGGRGGTGSFSNVVCCLIHVVGDLLVRVHAYMIDISLEWSGVGEFFYFCWFLLVE